MAEPAALRAVITGDLLRSSDLSRPLRAALPDSLHAISASVCRNFSEAVRHPIDIFRGDSWQLLVEDAALSLRVALFVRAELCASFEEDVDTRLAIGIGTIDFVPEVGVSAGDGEAFRLSGEALDEMPRAFSMSVTVSDCLPASIGQLIDAVAKLIDLQAATWTRRQAYAVGRALLDQTQAEIGEAWLDRPVSQQAVAQHLSGAGWSAIHHGIRAAESVLSTFTSR